MKIGIIGRHKMLYNSIIALADQGHQFGAIITSSAPSEYACKENEFEDIARKLEVPFLLTENLDDPAVTEICRGLDLGISINWGTIISGKQLSLFQLGILNVHAGDLPQYRGNASPNWAIIKGEKNITLSVHFMEEEKLDCGRIVTQEHFNLTDNTNIKEIYTWMENITPKLLVKSVEILSSDPHFSIKTADADAPDSFRCYPRLPEDGFIDWNSSVLEIHNLIRASGEPFAGAYTYHLSENTLKKLIILESRIVSSETKDLAVPGHVIENNPSSGESFVRCRDGILALIRCRYEDEEPSFLPGQKLKSIRLRLGIRKEDLLWKLTQESKEPHEL